MNFHPRPSKPYSQNNPSDAHQLASSRLVVPVVALIGLLITICTMFWQAAAIRGADAQRLRDVEKETVRNADDIKGLHTQMDTAIGWLRAIGKNAGVEPIPAKEPKP